MLITGIVGQNGVNDTANLVNSIFSSTGKKISIVDAKNLAGLDSKRIKSYVFELLKSGIDILILKINLQNSGEEILESIHFDVMIYTDKADEFKEDQGNDHEHFLKRMISLLDEKGIAILNADDSEIIQFVQGMKHPIVTYGFNSKASVTTSSIGDPVFNGNFICSLQQTISTKNGRMIEPQEYIIPVQAGDTDSYNILAAASFAIVNGVDLNSLAPSGMKLQ
ncbi:MAG: Mur ligase family protein [Clostridia bacterium]|nr:Mur ligase family protein [Clostridia bacterium]